jgi:hypothetical protein
MLCSVRYRYWYGTWLNMEPAFFQRNFCINSQWASHLQKKLDAWYYQNGSGSKFILGQFIIQTVNITTVTPDLPMGVF